MPAKFKLNVMYRIRRTVVGVNDSIVSEIRTGDTVTVVKVRDDRVLVRSGTGLMAWVSKVEVGEYRGETK